MFSIGNEKAYDLDGYNASFFKFDLYVVGQDVLAATLEYFNSFFLHSRFNSTSLMLVPNKKCP